MASTTDEIHDWLKGSMFVGWGGGIKISFCLNETHWDAVTY